MDNVYLFYHDSRYLLVTWEEELKPAPSGLFNETDLASALAWGLNRPETKALDADTANAVVKSDNQSVKVQAWKRPGTVMLLAVNTGGKDLDAKLNLDLDKLGVKVRKIWEQYTQAPGAKKFDAISGELTVNVKAGQSALVFVDTY